MWQPIETAPKDCDISVLVYAPKEMPSIYVCKYAGPTFSPWTNDPDGEWIEAGGEGYSRFAPTHWMPLPQPPE
jgi:hypothetical protein